MHVLGFQEAVDLIVEKHPCYRSEAYFFLHDTLNFSLKRRRKNRKNPSVHLSALELLEGFRAKALQEFGPMAITVLYYWGIKKCEDIGQMVFYLIETGVLGRTQDDTLSTFSNVFDFEEAFVTPFQPKSSFVSTAELPVLKNNL